MHPKPVAPSNARGSLSLVGLEALPCGCVSSVYLAQPSIVELELVEAKGPHCRYYAHQTGRVVRLGIPGEFDED